MRGVLSGVAIGRRRAWGAAFLVVLLGGLVVLQWLTFWPPAGADVEPIAAQVRALRAATGKPYLIQSEINDPASDVRNLYTYLLAQDAMHGGIIEGVWLQASGSGL